jgi:hypothetical protein
MAVLKLYLHLDATLPVSGAALETAQVNVRTPDPQLLYSPNGSLACVAGSRSGQAMGQRAVDAAPLPLAQVVRLLPDADMAQLRATAQTAFAAHGVVCGSEQLRLCGAGGKPLPLACRLGDRLRNGDDVFATVHGPPAPSPPVQEATGLTTGPPAAAPAATRRVEAAAAAPAPPQQGEPGPTSDSSPTASATKCDTPASARQAASSPAPSQAGTSREQSAPAAPAAARVPAAATTGGRLAPLVSLLWREAETQAAAKNYRAASVALQEVGWGGARGCWPGVHVYRCVVRV